MQFPIGRVRFVAVSATIPNVRDIAEWLDVDLARGLHVFGEDYRPVRLVTHVRGYNMTKVRRMRPRLFRRTCMRPGLNQPFAESVRFQCDTACRAAALLEHALRNHLLPALCARCSYDLEVEVSCVQTDFLFERRLNEHLYSAVAEFSKGAPAKCCIKAPADGHFNRLRDSIDSTCTYFLSTGAAGKPTLIFCR